MELGLSSDGWERKFNQISNLKFLVRATCAFHNPVPTKIGTTSKACLVECFP